MLSVKSSCISLLRHLIHYLIDDFKTGRLRGVMMVGLSNLLPDLLAFCFLRPYFWKLAGVKLKDCSTVCIRKNAFVEYPNNVSIGSHFQINRDSFLQSNGPITIGNFVTISVDCKILTSSHLGENHEIDVIRSTELRDHCIIYANSIIMPGSTVAEHVIISSGSVLRGLTEPKGIYAGNPAVLVGFRKDLDPK